MKNIFLNVFISISILMLLTACNTVSTRNEMSNFPESPETLYVYEDGKMKLDSRYVDSEDVVIYPDGQGGEKAAVKVRVPIHSDFYRDSIIVVRVINKYEESVAQEEAEDLNNIN